MRETELYRHLRDIVDPWTVSRVALDVTGGRLDVWAERAKKARQGRAQGELEGVLRLSK